MFEYRRRRQERRDLHGCVLVKDDWVASFYGRLRKLPRSESFAPFLPQRLLVLSRRRSSHLYAALGLTLLSLLSRGGLELPVGLSLLALLFAGAAGIFIVLGGIGWAMAQLVRLLVLWRAKEEIREGMTPVQMTGVIAVVIALGVPEFAHAIVWWHEHALVYIPGEEETVDEIGAFIIHYAEPIILMTIVAGSASLLFWSTYQHMPERLRRTAVILRTMLTHRDWRVPGILLVTIVATVLFLRRDPSRVLYDLLAIQIIASAIWVMLPLIIPNLYWLAGLPASFLTANVVRDQLVVAGWLGDQNSFPNFWIAILWAAWLFSVLLREMSRTIYWIGVLAVVLWLALSPDYSPLVPRTLMRDPY
jgi:hypothetical protein